MEQRAGLYRNKSQGRRKSAEHLAGGVWLIGTDYMFIVLLLVGLPFLPKCDVCFVLFFIMFSIVQLTPNDL